MEEQLSAGEAIVDEGVSRFPMMSDEDWAPPGPEQIIADMVAAMPKDWTICWVIVRGRTIEWDLTTFEVRTIK